LHYSFDHDIIIYGSLVKRLRRRPLTAETRVRFPYGLLSIRSRYIHGNMMYRLFRCIYSYEAELFMSSCSYCMLFDAVRRFCDAKGNDNYLLYFLYIFSNAGIERFIISLSTQYDILTQPGQPKPSAATMSTSSSFAFSQNALLSSSSAFTNI
jgi:hypothetical protein